MGRGRGRRGRRRLGRRGGRGRRGRRAGWVLTSPRVDSWYHEKESAWLYRRVAAAEADPKKSDLFLKLAAAAEEQAAKWQLAARRDTAGGGERVFVPSLR